MSIQHRFSQLSSDSCIELNIQVDKMTKTLHRMLLNSSALLSLVPVSMSVLCFYLSFLLNIIIISIFIPILRHARSPPGIALNANYIEYIIMVTSGITYGTNIDSTRHFTIDCIVKQIGDNIPKEY